jgi:UDP-N-acetylmuramoyl-tripeptide--D-alanyl-D-alanine ligase
VIRMYFRKKKSRHKGSFKRLFAGGNKKRIFPPRFLKYFSKVNLEETGKGNQISLVDNHQTIKEKIHFPTFCTVIKGTVVTGPKEFMIQNIIDRSIYLKKPNTVLFIREKLNEINWGVMEKFQTFAIVFEKGKDLTPYLPNVTYITVESMEQSYWDFVNYYRDLFDIPVFAITGTCGKTTTKEMITHILNEKYQVQSTAKSNNSFYANLAYLCGITNETVVAVFETPVGGPGLIVKCCKYFKPTIGMITNIGIDHIQQCGTLDNYIHAKGEILIGLNYKGILLLNADDENTKKISLERYKGRVIYFGVHAEAEYQAKNIQYLENGMAFALVYENINYDVFVPGYGEHQVYNALSAIAAVHQIGFPISEAARRIRSFVNLVSHIETFKGYNGATIINDTWSSNPTSIKAALEVFKNIVEHGRRKIAVIGTVSLLGDDEVGLHREIGEIMAAYELDTLITCGRLASEIANGAMTKNMKNIIVCENTEEVAEILLPLLNENTALLVKTSMYDRSVLHLIKKLQAR